MPITERQEEFLLAAIEKGYFESPPKVTLEKLAEEMGVSTEEARGELRAVNTLFRSNPRTLPTAAAVAVNLPRLVVGGWRRHTPGPRLQSLPGWRA